ncbi:MAG: hypothetical protein QXG39_09990 [Candidatus Aenigmatarchaeota archaeon]
MEQSSVISVRLSANEREILEKLAKYLHVTKKIEEPNISDTIRFCIYFTLNEILKAIEVERYG